MEQRHGEDQKVPIDNATFNHYDNSRRLNANTHYGDNVQYNNSYHQYMFDDRSRSSKRPLDRLEEWVSKGAAHDSAERGTDAPKCWPETREAVQEETLSFIHPGCDERIMWLSGPAGAGKTAIMGSIAGSCHRRGWLAGSFFFSASSNAADRCSKRYIVPTLAYHLFQLNILGLPSAILASIEAHPSVFDKRLDQQVEILLLGPLRDVIQNVGPSTGPKVVLVDGVDECSPDYDGRTYATEDDHQRAKEENYREVLSALTQASKDPAFPFRIIISSRPEPAIERYFLLLPAEAGVKCVFLDNKYSPEADVELYTRAMLSKIGVDHGLASGWFTPVGRSQGIDDVPKYVAEESSGQFIYAATVIRFVQGNSAPAPKQLERVLNWRSTDTFKPFAALDALYAGILRTSPTPLRAAFFIRSSWYLQGSPPWYFYAVLESSVGEFNYLLGPLSSLVRIVDSAGKPDFCIYHKSLTDFLWDPERSYDLCMKHSFMDFIRDRFYEVLKNRGPQVPLLGDGTGVQFLEHFCGHIMTNFSVAPKYQFTIEDVIWVLVYLRDQRLVTVAYAEVHKNCSWYACQRGCKVWRKGLLCYAKANGWRGLRP